MKLPISTTDIVTLCIGAAIGASTVRVYDRIDQIVSDRLEEIATQTLNQQYPTLLDTLTSQDSSSVNLPPPNSFALYEIIDDTFLRDFDLGEITEKRSVLYPFEPDKQEIEGVMEGYDIDGDKKPDLFRIRAGTDWIEPLRFSGNRPRKVLKKAGPNDHLLLNPNSTSYGNIQKGHKNQLNFLKYIAGFRLSDSGYTPFDNQSLDYIIQ